MSSAGLAADPHAPYARLAVVGLIRREGQGGVAGPATGEGAAPKSGAQAGEDRWLLLHRTRPLQAWDPPGGRMEAGEDLVRAVKREVEEETGLSVEVAGPCYAFLTFYEGERLLAVSMACRPMGDPDSVRLEQDGAEGWQWATGREWEDLAATRRSSWDPADIKRATRAVAGVWEAQSE